MDYEPQEYLFEIELKCSVCNMPLKLHTTTQLHNCDSIRRVKDNIAKNHIRENSIRKHLIETLKDKKQ